MDKEKRKSTNKYKVQKRVTAVTYSTFRTIIIIGLSFVILFPIITSLIPAITDFNFLGDPSSLWLPTKPSGLAFKVASSLLSYKKAVVVTLLYAASIALLQVVVSAIVGYGFAKMQSRWKHLLFFLVILTIIVPVQAITVPQQLYFRQLKIEGNIASLYLISLFCMGLKSGLFIYLFKQYFEGLPKELEEAAAIDGCGFTKTFLKIMLPNATTVMLTVFVFSFVWNYSDIYYVRWFAENNPLLSLLINNNILNEGRIKGEFATQTFLTPDSMPELFPGAVAGAGQIMFVFPMIIFYIFIQRKFVQGFERSGLTGQ